LAKVLAETTRLQDCQTKIPTSANTFGLAGAVIGFRVWYYCPRAKIRKKFKSPVHKINGFVYHDNWLHNMLISTSIAGSK